MRLSRIRATRSAIASPSAKDASVSGIVPFAAPARIGPSEVRTSSQSMVSCQVAVSRTVRPGRGPRSVGDVLAEVLLGDLGERAVLAQLLQRSEERRVGKAC